MISKNKDNYSIFIKDNPKKNFHYQQKACIKERLTNLYNWYQEYYNVKI